MAAEETRLSEAFPMKAGAGPNSYAKNSTYQRGVADAAKELLTKAIAENLDTEILLSSNTFHIADLGCSVGPNTFYAVKNILESVQSKYQSKGPNSQIPEFQVFFNDHTTNDFNILFKSLPHNRHYHAAGVPGSFYGRIFPNASVHIVHSSYTNHWLSRVPKDVTDSNSPAWNKGRIHYLKSTDEVVRAYEDQFARDMECFLHVRSQEIVNGGLMVLTIPGRPDGTPHSHAAANVTYQLLGTCLIEMAKKIWKNRNFYKSIQSLGKYCIPNFFLIISNTNDQKDKIKPSKRNWRIYVAWFVACRRYFFLNAATCSLNMQGIVSEDKVDAFNIPIYYMSPKELEAAVEQNGCFSVEGMEILPYVSTLHSVAKTAPLIALHVRAATEGLFKLHFGDAILDELFDLYCKNLVAQHCIFKSTEVFNFFAVLKRKAN
ncbi:putative loganate O-methyltransferase [Rosa chinensis]|uniref:Putative loganate O-methyltransferase n=1 Tax=Rosa chinensis TaxID=74649 RepID=A0A2P6P204_ROSCH|nr:putative loganate O-methyltransferase [Rosa chinensis]